MPTSPVRRLWKTLRIWLRLERSTVDVVLQWLAETEDELDAHRRLIWSLAHGLPRCQLPPGQAELLDQIVEGDLP